MAAGTLIVIPCYNEAARLDRPGLFASADADPDTRFLLVDDGSTDDTAAVHREMAATHPSFSALVLSKNGGKAEAVRQGFLRGLAEGHWRWIGYWDADLATPLSDVACFRDLGESRPEVEFILGARVELLGRHVQRNPARHYLGRVAATAASSLLGLPVYDTQCGAKLFRVTPRLPALFAEPFSTRWAFDVEIIARWIGAMGGGDRAALARLLVEYPLERWTDVPGSKLRLADVAALPFNLSRIAIRYRRELAR